MCGPCWCWAARGWSWPRPPWARRRFVTWGATAGEAAGTLSGDDLLPDVGLVSTRAVTIGAPPSAVWPWLVQMGSGRGGA
ncbi:hypothetical protein [Actinoplanes sp. NPDC048796]|uniref:hypothetical protein n=1 Tax=Actinoplanes sp. NPDC048796 TaxID=3155640 RepID=UPI0033E66465